MSSGHYRLQYSKMAAKKTLPMMDQRGGVGGKALGHDDPLENDKSGLRGRNEPCDDTTLRGSNHKRKGRK